MKIIKPSLGYRHHWFISYIKQAMAGRFNSAYIDMAGKPCHFLISVANHFEPEWQGVSHDVGMKRLGDWIDNYEKHLTLQDEYGEFFKHSYFFPVEQYHPEYLDVLTQHCRRGYGEIEVHIHHGLEKPDTADNLRADINHFNDLLIHKHHWKVTTPEGSGPCYAFVHGNWALANSAHGENCGIDDEIEILNSTGCYVDMTLPSAPDVTQISKINSIYWPSQPLNRPIAHRTGEDLSVFGGRRDPLFFLVQGPLLLNWKRRIKGLPFPRVENGDLSFDHLPSLERFRLWVKAHVHVKQRPEWIFIKLHCHGLQEKSLDYLSGPFMNKFLSDLLEEYRETEHKIHFVSAREMANIALAAVDGREGCPNEYKDYYWKLN